jgi:hypothetical protein
MNRVFVSRCLLTICSLIAVTLSVPATSAVAAPTLTNVSLRGLQIGGTTVIAIDGKELMPDPQVLLPFPIAKQTVQPGANPNRVQIEITLDASVPAGIYQLRVANAKGISNALAVGVDRLPQQPFAEQIASLPIALHGNLSASQILRTSVAGKKGQRIVVDLEGRRLGSSVKPVVRLYDPRGTQLTWSPPQFGIGGDARCEAVLPSDGQYTIEVHDLLYRGANPGFFRLKIGDLHYADMAYPIGVQQGVKTPLKFVSSNLPATTTVNVEAAAADPRTDRAAPRPPVDTFTGAPPRIIVSPHAEAIEAAPAGAQLQTVEAPPVGINGRIATAGEEDKYLLSVKPGMKLRFDVLARRIGSPLDGVLAIRGEAGNQLATNDDRPGTPDPGLDFTVPANVNKIVVALKDLEGRGGDTFIYRIGVTDIGRPNFDLTIDADTINIPAGGTAVVNVQVARAGYNGPIQLAVEGLPKSVQLAGDLIPAGDTIGLLTITAPNGTALRGLASIIGRSTEPQSTLVSVARVAETSASVQQPWLRSELGLAVSEPSPIGIAWSQTGAADKLLLGGRLPLNLKLTRAESAKGNVRLKLLTTQVMPKRTIKKDNKDEVVDDVDRALRLDGAPEFATGVQDATADVLVPADLPEKDWGLVLVAELLSADKKSVVATAVAPLWQLPAVRAVRLELASAANIEAKAGGGDTGQFTGKVVRMTGLNQPVTVTLSGLPEGYPPPQIVLAAGQSDFILPVSFPSGAKPAELKGVKLMATSQTDPKDPKSLVRGNEVPVTVKVVPGEK